MANKTPYHLVHKEFYDDVLTATEELLSKRLHRQSKRDQITTMQSWVNTISGVYAMVAPTVTFLPDHGMYIPPKTLFTGSTILMKRASNLSLMHLYRHAMQHILEMKFEDDIMLEYDAFAWSTSLYYTVKPVTFKRLVLEGKVYGVKPEDLKADSDATS